MNLFDFLMTAIEFGSQSFGNFVVAFLFIGLTAVGLIAMLNAISGFRLFNINKSDKSNDNQTLKLTSNPVQDTAQSNNIYDMLVDAYDRYKDKKNNKGSDDTK